MTDNISTLLSSESLKDFKKGARMACSGCSSEDCALILSRLEGLDIKRSWEAACLALRVLGLASYVPAKDCVFTLWSTGEDHSMVSYTAAEAHVRINRTNLNDTTPVMEILERGGYSQIEGALNPLGYDRMLPSDSEIESILDRCWDFGIDRDKRGLGDPRYGLVAACAGWIKIPRVVEFLKHCESTGDAPVQHVAQASLRGEYVKLR